MVFKVAKPTDPPIALLRAIRIALRHYIIIHLNIKYNRSNVSSDEINISKIENEYAINCNMML